MKIKNNLISLRIAAALLVLVLLSLCLNCGLLARYTSEASSDASGHVAAFSVIPGESYTAPAIPLGDMAPGEEKSFNFTVSSASEVTVKCTVTVTTTGNLPLVFNIKTSGGDPAETFEIEPNHGEVTLTLAAVWPEEYNQLTYLDEIDALQLTVKAEQVD